MLVYDVNKTPFTFKLVKPPPHKQRNSVMGTCSFGRKDTTKLLMVTAALYLLVTALVINC